MYPLTDEGNNFTLVSDLRQIAWDGLGPWAESRRTPYESRQHGNKYRPVPPLSWGTTFAWLVCVWMVCQRDYRAMELRCSRVSSVPTAPAI